MDRATVYTQEQGRSVDFLFAQRATLIGLGKLSQAAFGSGTVVRGLPVTPNSPAALNVLVGIGEIYAMTQVDATAWGSLPADTADTILKQGLNMAAQTIATPAPTTGGFSICYLIEAQYQDQDNVTVVLPFYNAANPSIPLNGQGGGGAAQATERQGVCVIQAKAGTAAATGTQVAPTVDSGWTALAVVTVAFGATTVVAGNIAVAAGIAQISSLLQMLQTESTNYALDTSITANQITIALTPPITAYTDGQPLKFQAANTCTGPCTINAGPSSISLNGAAGAFQGGEIVAGKFYEAVYRANSGTAVVIGQTGGALQVSPATQSGHAVQLGQLTGIVGDARGLSCFIAAAGSATATWTATRLILEDQNGVPYKVANFSGTLNLATTGLNGMDVTANPASASHVAVYAMLNPTTGVKGVIGVLTTGAIAPETYGGTAQPAGFTVSALISVWVVGTTGILVGASQTGRKVSTQLTTSLVTSTQAATFTALTLTATPKNAKKVWGALQALSNAAATSIHFIVSVTSYSLGQTDSNIINTWPVNGDGYSMPFDDLAISTPQTLYYEATATGGATPTFSLFTTAYEF